MTLARSSNLNFSLNAPPGLRVFDAKPNEEGMGLFSSEIISGTGMDIRPVGFTVGLADDKKPVILIARNF